MIVYDIQTFNTDKIDLCSVCIFKLSQVSGSYNGDTTDRQLDKCRNDCIVFDGSNRINEMLEHVLEFKGETRRLNKSFVKHNLYFIAHKGSRFDSFVVINNLPPWRTVTNVIKTGAGIVSFKKYNGNFDKKEKIPRYVQFRCSRVHINNSFEKIVESYKLQQGSLKQEMNHEEVYEDTWEDKKTNDYRILRTMYCRQRSVMLGIQKEWRD